VLWCYGVMAYTIPVTISQLCIEGNETSELLAGPERAVPPLLIRGFSWQWDAVLNGCPHTTFYGSLCTPGSVLCSINLEGSGNGALWSA
jgi:hypothetical protein